MKKGVIAVFDFDGTLTKKDSVIEFAKHCVGKQRLFGGMMKSLPWILAWKFRILDGGKAKLHLFSSLYKGMEYSAFRRRCNDFISNVEEFQREDVVDKLHRHLQAGHRVFIVSASIREWILPWAMNQGVKETNVIGTGMEVDTEGIITGRFSTPNCKGVEKVRRLKSVVTDLEEYEVYAYGDSAGDLQMLAIADHPEMIK